jgi:serine/threonine protein kinase
MWTRHQSINDGKYIIQNVLGEGGFGITYSAIEQSTGELVAIKTLNGKRQRAKDFPKQQERFVNEAFNLRAFSHPHIVKVYKMIQEDGLWGMVMEFIDGVDLNDYVDENGQLSEDDALLYIDQIGQALEYIHQQDGMIHRDIKPHNMVLRRGKKEAVLVDFGLACNIDKFTTRDGRTPGYAPPEQYTPGEQLGFYTDVYALATTLYYLLTADGMKDKDEYIHESIIRKYGALPLEPPQYYNSRISKRVNDAIIKGMELEVENRPQTVGEFRELLGLLIPPIVNILPIVEVLDEASLDQEVELKSAVGIDYTQLRDLLAAEKWKEADQETARVMLAVAKREEEKWFRDKHIKNFPCQDLRTIDQLWLKYSNGRFGFSVQQRIYQGLDATGKHKLEMWEAFGNAVGWRKDGEWLVFYKDISFDITAPEAHLPIAPWKRGLGGLLGGLGGWVGSCLFSRIESCQLSHLKLKVEIQKVAPVESVELKSAIGMDYSKLCDLLTAGKWKEADEETTRVILAVAKQEKSGRLDIEHIDNFPCEDLRTIDQLWVKYSNGRFGFSVQKRIYQSYGGTRNYDPKVWEAFGEKVGWRKGGNWLHYESIIFGKTAPVAHLPSDIFWWVDFKTNQIKKEVLVTTMWVGDIFACFFSRVETCNL